MAEQAESEGRVIPEQRREHLLGALRREKVLSVHQLTEMLGVSHMTVRRDISALEEEGHAIAVPGGVKLSATVRTEPSRADKSALQNHEKSAIGREAAGFVEDGMVVYLDAGTTMLAALAEIEGRENLTVITNDFVIVEHLAATGTGAIHIGGFVDHENRSTVGSLAARMLDHLNPDIAFISASSWSLKHGVTTPSPGKLDVKQAAMARATDRILLADSSKYGQFSAYTAAQLNEFDAIVTDSGLRESAAEAIRGRGINLRVGDGAA